MLPAGDSGDMGEGPRAASAARAGGALGGRRQEPGRPSGLCGSQRRAGRPHQPGLPRAAPSLADGPLGIGSELWVQSATGSLRPGWARPPGPAAGGRALTPGEADIRQMR